MTRLRALALMSLATFACGGGDKIPRSGLREIRRLALDEATKRYVLSDAAIDANYQPPKVYPKSETELQGKYDPWSQESFSSGRRIPAVASVRGVELLPATRTSCVIKFDFEPSRNPHARLPDNEAKAERFEKVDGSQYWVIEWR